MDISEKGFANLFSIVRGLLGVGELQGRLVGRRLVPVHVSHQFGTRGTVDDQIGYLKDGRHECGNNSSFVVLMKIFHLFKAYFPSLLPDATTR